MIVDVHTHLPTHDAAVPDDEIELDTAMRPGRQVRLTNSVEDYLDAMAGRRRVRVRHRAAAG